MEAGGGKGGIVNPHKRFFSSLRHLEQRLSSEPNTNNNTNTTTKGNPNTTLASSPSPSHFSSLSNVSSPLFLAGGHQTPSAHPTSSSAPPPEFLPSQLPADEEDDNDVERLMGLLDLSPEVTGDEEGVEDCFQCSSGDGFYRRVADVKGPKCERERRRVEGWIRHYRFAGGEPARLAFLLLGKAANSGDLEFPEAVEGHLEWDPPCSHR